MAATGVGDIHINFVRDKLKIDIADQYKPIPLPLSKKIEKGEELGKFKLGSTVVMIIEVPKNFEWKVKDMDVVRYGDVIGSINHK